MKVGVDLMGSDRTPTEILAAVLEVSQTLDSKDSLVVFGTKEVLDQVPSSIERIEATQIVEMSDEPLVAFRTKKDSSMTLGIEQIREKQLDAFVSTGNTGALMATALLQLKRLPGVHRPALMVMVPNGKRDVAVLDVGANLTPKPEHIVSFAKMGVAYRQLVHGIENPTTGLLNVGAEEQKGPKELKETYRLMKETFGSSFKGNIEGREVFLGKVDVLATDGFTGNVFLKTSEGISSYLFDYLKESFPQEPAVQKIAAHLYENFNYSKHPGALLCGVDGAVIKCHGHSNKQALVTGIIGAFDVARKGVVERMKTIQY
ncbi:MAG: Phosphate acyltransferase [Chlamydiales bacterium]|nr:Phosphate acyltransferase [Chlamydiales bacterium]MCH9635552.1 Phosphate acyltransferase [Chlamydiales bacterium]MCH9703898.1 phosphate acyltransferase PlsX [Chlamydiota bacterium]